MFFRQQFEFNKFFFDDQAGPRICLGKEFAYRQMKITAATLIHFFRFKQADESKDATYKTMFTLHMDKGLHLYAYPRSTWTAKQTIVSLVTVAKKMYYLFDNYNLCKLEKKTPHAE